MSEAVITSERREELIAEISYRMKGSGEKYLQLHVAMDIENQPTNALETWLRYLKRCRINGEK